jgi:hypothetical protein
MLTRTVRADHVGGDRDPLVIIRGERRLVGRSSERVARFCPSLPVVRRTRSFER